MEQYKNKKSFLFNEQKNEREKVLKNIYNLNKILHKKNIDEQLRGQFIGTTLLYIRDVQKHLSISVITDDTKIQLITYWNNFSSEQIRSDIEKTLVSLLNGSDNRDLKVKLLVRNVLDNNNVKSLTSIDWIDILNEIVENIYTYIDTDQFGGQDVLSLFFDAFNKYTRRLDKNQVFTPAHIANFMCRVAGVDKTKIVFDGTCGSGSLLIQAMFMEMVDCNQQEVTEIEKNVMCHQVVTNHIYGVELEDGAFGLSTTNMLIHGNVHSNIKNINFFNSEEIIRQIDPDIILMNPPYNAKPITIPIKYKISWKSDTKVDPTKGMVFLKYLSDVIKKMNVERIIESKPAKEVKVAILLPVATAIGTSKYISNIKKELLKDNTLDAVFTLPDEIFYPGASVSACCMMFTLGRPHVMSDGEVPKTFFGYYKEDGHKKKKNLGRIEQFDKDNNSIWKQIEDEWLDLYRNKIVKDGMSAMQTVTGDDEWLCEAYMKTDYSKLSEADFQQTLNDYLAYLIKEGKIYES